MPILELKDNPEVFPLLAVIQETRFYDVKDPAVGDGNLMGVTSQVLNGVAEAVKCFFNVRAPFFFIKAVQKFFPGIRITQAFAGRSWNV